jgi:hypothetical protein
MSTEEPKVGSPGVLRAAALIAVVVGGVGSVALTLLAGHRNPSRILMALFVFWVLSPFVGLAWAGVVSKRWPLPIRTTLYSVMLVVTLGALAVYGYTVVRPPAKLASVFLLTPLVSWLLIGVLAIIRRGG